MAAPAAAPDKDEPSRAQKDALAALKAATEKPLNPAADAAAKAPDFETLVAAAEETGLSKGKAMRSVPDEEQLVENGRVVCRDCGEPIPAARLAACPEACRCVVCQEAAEASGDR